MFAKIFSKNFIAAAGISGSLRNTYYVMQNPLRVSSLFLAI